MITEKVKALRIPMPALLGGRRATATSWLQGSLASASADEPACQRRQQCRGGYTMFGCRDALLQINLAIIGLAILLAVVAAGLAVLATAQ
jgi:hypothetical protein